MKHILTLEILLRVQTFKKAGSGSACKKCGSASLLPTYLLVYLSKGLLKRLLAIYSQRSCSIRYMYCTVRNICTMDQNPDTTFYFARTVMQKRTCNEPTACVTPSPASNTTPVVRPVAYKLSTACSDTKSAGTLKVSKNISAAFSRFRRGFSGASVSNTGCSSENVCS